MPAVLTERQVRERVEAFDSFMPSAYSKGYDAGFTGGEFEPDADYTTLQRRMYTDGFHVGRDEIVRISRAV